MTTGGVQAARWRAAVLGAALVAGIGGYWLGQSGGDEAAPSGGESRKVLYYFDPMFPNQKFEKPGKSPFMEMELVPKYADEGMGAVGGSPGVSIDPAAMQSLGVRIVAAELGTLQSGFVAAGTIEFSQRDVAVVQARAGGFVTRVYGRAPGDVIGPGAPIADVQSPEWGGAQTEFLAVRKLGRPALTAAARQRLLLLGMSDATIAQVERSGRTSGTVTIVAPIGGAIQSLDARRGVTLAQGQTLAEINGIGTVWLNAAVPEVQADLARVGQRATATLAAFPGESFGGRVIAILPADQADSRTLTVRIELANRGGRLRPGMFASVALGGDARTALLVPSEAVIRTGTRTIVMLASKDGRYHPAEVRAGRESGGQTEIFAGLAAGEKVVASGQFLLDSEASLTGVAVRPLDAPK